jgi:dual specificity phosphatase 12
MIGCISASTYRRVQVLQFVCMTWTHPLDPIVSLEAATSKDTLDAYGITHILSVCPVKPQESGMASSRQYMNISVDDSEYENLLPHLPAACDFIESAIGGTYQNADVDGLVDEGDIAKARKECKILVHCFMGVSRSVSVVSAYCESTSIMCLII